MNAHLVSARSHAPALPRPRRGWVAAAVASYRQRRALARLDDARLADLGLSRAEALTEARRPVWDVPGHWLR